MAGDCVKVHNFNLGILFENCRFDECRQVPETRAQISKQVKTEKGIDSENESRKQKHEARCRTVVDSRGWMAASGMLADRSSAAQHYPTR
jgi:hypothetical protein